MLGQTGGVCVVLSPREAAPLDTPTSSVSAHASLAALLKLGSSSFTRGPGSGLSAPSPASGAATMLPPGSPVMCVFLSKTQQDLLGDVDKLVLKIVGESKAQPPQEFQLREPSARTQRTFLQDCCPRRAECCGGGADIGQRGTPGAQRLSDTPSQVLAEAQKPFSGGSNSLFNKRTWRPGHPQA